MKGPHKMLPRLALVASLSFSLFSFFPHTTQAEPVFGKQFEFTQPDGSIVPVKIWGDEFYRRVESLDGYTLIKDPSTGWICYARLADDGQSFVSSGIVYYGPSAAAAAQEGDTFNVSATPFGIPQGLKLPTQAIQKIAQEAKTELFAPQLATQSENGVMIAAEPAASADSIQAAGGVENVVGLTLLIDFSDDVATFTSQEMSDLYNQEGYTRFGNNGSIRDYFYDVSGGHLVYTNQVTAYYRAQHPKSYYTDETVGYGTRARELIFEALNWLENQQGFDFSTLSTKSGGYVRALNVMYAGNVSNAWAKGLWPHRSSLGGFSADGVTVNDYQITNIGSLLTIGTIAHENGHMLFNWPDLYDYDYDSAGAGRFALMAYYGSSFNPVPPNAYFRHKQGWDTVTDIDSTAVGQTLSLVANSNTSYRYPNPFDSSEAFYIENRRKTGRNTFLPDEGLMIWHVANGSNNWQDRTCARHFHVSVVQADGLFQLENNTGNGDTNDLFDANSFSSFSDATNPNANWWCNGPSGLSISNIGPIGDNISFFVNESQILKATKAGWPKSVLQNGTTFWSYSAKRTPSFVDLDGDGTQEVVSYSDDHLVVWDAQGNLFPNFPIELPLDLKTSEVLTFADLDGNGTQEIILYFQGNGERKNTVYAFDYLGNAVAGFPAGGSDLIPAGSYYVNSNDNPVIASDLDHDGADELIVSANYYGSTSLNGYLGVIKGDGSFAQGWPVVPQADMVSREVKRYLVADLDSDGQKEVIVFSRGTNANNVSSAMMMSIYNKNGALVRSVALDTRMLDIRSALVADLNQDGTYEIVLSALLQSPYVARLYVIDAQGNSINSALPYEFGNVNTPSLSVADLTDGRNLEIVAQTGNQVYVFSTSGVLKTGYPKTLTSPQVDSTNFYNNSTAVGLYLNGEDKSSLLISSNKGLHLFNSDLVSVDFWPYQNGLMTTSTPTVGDVDNDGIMDLAGIVQDGSVILYELDSTVAQSKKSIWSTTYANNQRTSVVTEINAGALAHKQPQVYFRGTPNNFAIDRPMSLVDDYLWEIEVEVGAGTTQRFKFDIFANWATNFGDTNKDNYAEQGGADIYFTQGAGNYRIRWNDNTNYYSVTKIIGNQAPVANAGADLNVAVGAAVQFDGSASYDPDGSIVSYVWTHSTFPAAGLTGVNPSFTFANAGTYEVTLTVTDNQGKVATDVVKVVVGQASSWQRTVIFIYGQTQSGQDMFIRGGIDHGYANTILGKNCQVTNFECALPIKHNNLRNATTAPWKQGDQYLDWYGAESTQSSQSQGTPLDWTTDVWPSSWGTARTVAVDGYGVTPLNTFGQHYWMLDVDMDCSKTVNGWFELKSFISNGPGWEANVTQPNAPYASGNHFAQCGKLNVFRRGESNPVTIGNL